MEKKVQNINGEEQYRDVIKLLKELPKIKAPDNFELNLMTRIHNENFEIKRDKSSDFTIWGFLKPAAAVSLTAVIAFVVFDLSSFDAPNPLLTEPEPMSKMLSDRENVSLQKEFIVEESVMGEKEDKDEAPRAMAGASASAPQNQAYKVVINENDVISKEILNFPMDDKSVDVDSRLKKRSPREANEAVITVGSGSRQSQVFDGFHTRSIEFEWLRDSLKKIADTLGRAADTLQRK